MRRKPARTKPTPQTAPSGEPVGIVVPAVFSAAVTGGSVLALSLAGSLVLGGSVLPFGTTLADLRHPGSITALPRPPVAPPQVLLPAEPPHVIVPRRTAMVFLTQPASADARRTEKRRPPTRVTHRPRKSVEPRPDTSDRPGSGGPEDGSDSAPGGNAPGTAPGGGSHDGGGCFRGHGKHGHCTCHSKHGEHGHRKHGPCHRKHGKVKHGKHGRTQPDKCREKRDHVKHGRAEKDGEHRNHEHRNHEHRNHDCRNHDCRSHHETAHHDADDQPVITVAVTGSAEAAPGSIVEVVTGMQVGTDPTEGDV